MIYCCIPGLLSLLACACLSAQEKEKPTGNFNQALGQAGVASRIELGMAWVIARLQPDGQFVADKPGPGGPSPVAVHSLCLLMLMADGSSLRVGPHRRQVKLAARWLRNQGKGGGAPFDQTGLGQILACQAMAETAAISDSKLIGVSVRRALPVLEKLQNRDGGFPAGRAGQPSELVTSLHALLALQTYRRFSASPAGQMEKRLSTWLEKLPRDKTMPLHTGFIDQRREQTSAAAWMMARSFMVERPQVDELLLAEGHRILLAERKLDSRPLPITGYLLAHAAVRSRGGLLRSWAKKFRPQLLASQILKGPARGSFPPGEGAQRGDRLWSTALGVLALQSEYRYGLAHRR